MKSQFVIEEESVIQNLKTQYKKYIIQIPILMAINIAMFTAVPLDERSTYERFLVALPGYGYSPIIGFVLGLFIAVIPYKNLPYSRKYLRASLLTIYWINIICLTLVVLVMIMLLINKL